MLQVGQVLVTALPQVENEYGSYGCDKAYLAQMRDLIQELVRSMAVPTTPRWGTRCSSSPRTGPARAMSPVARWTSMSSVYPTAPRRLPHCGLWPRHQCL